MSRVTIAGFLSDERGATAIEYGLLAGLVGIALIGMFTVAGNSLINLFNTGAAETINNRVATIK